MRFISIILQKIKSLFLTKKYAGDSVVIRDYANSYIQSSNHAIKGNGRLLLSPNAVNRHETMKIRIDSGGKLMIDGKITFYSNTNIHVGKDALLTIGDGTYINEGSLISTKHSSSIGSKCAISNNVTIFDSDFHRIIGSQTDEHGITIGDHVWIGANATILKNVRIGQNCIIGANTVVSHNIPDNCIAVGNPAKIIKENVDWE